jgi:hypothetical protein
MALYELMKHVTPSWIPTHLDGVAHQLKVCVVHFFTMVKLDDHGMHDDTRIHDVPKNVLIPKSCRASHYSKLGLQNPKSFLNIFHSRRLAGAHTFEHLDGAELVRSCVLFALAGEVQPQRIRGGSALFKPSLWR